VINIDWLKCNTLNPHEKRKEFLFKWVVGNYLSVTSTVGFRRIVGLWLMGFKFLEENATCLCFL
jgi:hypothetical protein